MVNKCVIGADGTQSYVPLTAEEEAQRTVDDQADTNLRALRAAIIAREQTFIADSDRSDLVSRALTASLTDIETYIDNNITLSGATVAALRNEVQTVLRVVVKRIVKALVLNVRR